MLQLQKVRDCYNFYLTSLQEKISRISYGFASRSYPFISQVLTLIQKNQRHKLCQVRHDYLSLMGSFSFAKEKLKKHWDHFVSFFYSALEILRSWLWPCSVLNERKEGKGGKRQVSHVEKLQAARGPSPIFCLLVPLYFLFTAFCIISLLPRLDCPWTSRGFLSSHIGFPREGKTFTVL